ncbi:MAG: hypothetical protein WCS93_04535 [Candidatus Delongbacteria bacterium]
MLLISICVSNSKRVYQYFIFFGMKNIKNERNMPVNNKFCICPPKGAVIYI